MEASDFWNKVFWELWWSLLTKGSVNYNHLQSDGFRQIPLMIENHSRYKANKDKRQVSYHL
jgi:hypothetical protein